MNIFKRWSFLEIGRYLYNPALAEFIDRARALIVEVEGLAARFNVRSSQHEILLWEIDAIAAKINFLVHGSEIPSHLATSDLDFLLNRSTYVWRDAERVILDRMQAFHRDFEDLMGDRVG